MQIGWECVAGLATGKACLAWAVAVLNSVHLCQTEENWGEQSQVVRLKSK